MTYAPGREQGEIDIVTALAADHRLVARLLDHLVGAPAAQRAERFGPLVTTLVAHEVAEEEILYPAVRLVAPLAGDEVAARLHEQAEATVLLQAMERHDPTGEAFAAALRALQDAVPEHAAREEETIFPLLAEHHHALDRVTMGVRYEKAKAAAPTHPHPRLPQAPPGNLVLGPVAAVADRVRDALG
ncbi:MAG: hemerythrin domain-containing protein [Acidimicrobiales bacterium]